jgi:tetratricopeptide (TPR) repeat protein
MYLPENQELAHHFTYRAMVSHETWQAIRACREALAWDKYAPRANSWIGFCQFVNELLEELHGIDSGGAHVMLSVDKTWFMANLRRFFERFHSDLSFLDILATTKGKMSVSLLVLNNLMFPDPEKEDLQAPPPSSRIQKELPGLSNLSSPKNEEEEIEIYIKRSQQAFKAKRFEEAESCLRHALRISRDAEQQAEISKQLSVVYNAHGEQLMASIRLHRTRGETPLPALMREAYHCFEDAIIYDPDNPGPRQNLEILQRLS